MIVALKIFQAQLSSFDEIRVIEKGNFNTELFNYLEKNKKCRNFIFSPITSSEQEETGINSFSTQDP